MTDLSVVIPVYRSEDCLEELHRRLKKVLNRLTSRYEIIFVEDRGPDNSWKILCTLAKKDPKVRIFRLSRNFGQQIAITAGLSRSKGIWTLVMDSDLQDPPEEIPRLMAKVKEGYDLVLTKRKNKKLSLFRRLAGIFYFKMLSLFNQEHLNGEFGSFSILHRKVVEAFLKVQDRDRHYLFVLRWLGFKSATLEYEHGERYSGESSYSLKTLITLGFDGIFFQTTFLLHWIIYLGFFVSICGWISAFYFIYFYFFCSVPAGWTSLAVLTLIIGGFTLISTGITGLYIGKIFEQVKNRPLYVFDTTNIKGTTNE